MFFIGFTSKMLMKTVYPLLCCGASLLLRSEAHHREEKGYYNNTNAQRIFS